jgi:hypothetical protein
MTPEELTAKTEAWRKARQRLRIAAEDEAALQQWRNDLIRKAVNEGMTHRAVAEAVGGAPNGLLTGERVRQICNTHERTKR